MFAGTESRQREKKKGRLWGKERDWLNFLHKAMFIKQWKSDICISLTNNDKCITTY